LPSTKAKAQVLIDEQVGQGETYDGRAVKIRQSSLGASFGYEEHESEET